MKVELVDIDEIEEVIIAYATGDLSRRLEISDKRDDRDTIVAGINMLGEELEKTTISRDYFMNIYNSVSEILIYTNPKGEILDLNHATEKVLCKKADELKGIDIKTIINEEYHHLETKIREGFNTGDHFFTFEGSLIIDKNREIPVSCTLSKVMDRLHNHKGYLFIAKDITDKKNKEINELRIAISAQEKERKRLAYDLHDSLGQELNAIKMYLNALAVMDSKTEEYKSAFETCKLILDNSLETIQNISFDLMPKALENASLIQSIEELIKKLNLVTCIEYSFPNITIEMHKDCQINIYRIIQEFINNSLKHSQLSKLELKILQNEYSMDILLKDNGKGFDIDSVSKGNGIFNIKTRLQALNASYKFESEIGKGTKLEFTISGSHA